MKQTIKNSRISGYLEKIYRDLNNDFFGGELEEVFITIQSTPKAYGHVSCSKIWNSKTGLERYELNMGAGTIARPIEETVATMLHEMVHVYHLMNGIKDTSRGNAYHNKTFKAKAESVGLIIDYDKRIGWSVTTPSDELILYVADKGWTDVSMYRYEGMYFPIGGNGGRPASGDDDSATPPATKKPSSTRKYQCPCCKNSVRATKELFVICGDCTEKMIVVG